MTEVELVDGLFIEPEELRKVCKDLADLLVDCWTTRVEHPVEQVEQIDLELLASCVAGVLDPLGQLREWFSALLDTIASWIVESIQTYVYPFFASITGALDTIVVELGKIVSGVADSLTPIIRDVQRTLEAAFKTVVLDPINTLIEFANTVFPKISGYFDEITKAVDAFLTDLPARVSKMLSEALAGVSKTISDIITAAGETVRRLITTITVGLDAIVRTITALPGQMSAIISDVLAVVAEIPARIQSAIVGVVDFISGVAGQISSLLAPVIEAISALPAQIQGVIAGILDFISGFSAQVSSIVTGILETIAGIPAQIGDVVSGILDTIGEIRSVLAGVVDIVSAIPAQVGDTVSRILDTIGRIGAQLSAMITPIVEAIAAIPAQIQSIVANLVAIVSDLAARVSAIVPDILDMILKIPETVSAIVSEIVEEILGIPAKISEALSKTLDFIVKSSAQITDAIGSILEGIAGIPPAIGKAIEETVGKLTEFTTEALKVASEFVQTLMLLPEKAPELLATVAGYIWEKLLSPMFETIRDALVMPVVGAVDEIVKRVSAGFTELGKVTMGFVNAIMNFPIWFKTYLVDPLIQGFTTCVVEPLAHTVVPALQGLGEMIWGSLKWIWETVPEWFKTAVETLVGGVKVFAVTLSEIIFGLFKTLHEILEEPAKKIAEFFKELYGKVIEESGKAFTNYLAPLHMQHVKELGLSSPQFLTLEKTQEMYLTACTVLATGFFLPLWGQLPIRLLAWVATPLSRWLSDQDWKIRINLRPLGLGVDTEFSLAKALGASIHTYVEQLTEWLRHLGMGFAYGLAIWLTQPITRVMNFPARNIIPIMLPDPETTLEFTRRVMEYEYTYDGVGKLTGIKPTVFYKQSLDLARYYNALYGYSDESLRWFFSHKTEDFVKFVDRFNKVKNFPVSLVHSLPTPSDMARMMVRDMFGPIGQAMTVDGKTFQHPLDSFERAIAMRGMTRDMAYMYYLLHFRYPPPEKLWTFTIRAVCGLLWVEPPPREMEIFKIEADRLKAYTPKTPKYLNFKGNIVTPAFRRYMKWHDYALFSWIDGMTSDNLINIDVLADIPTKIDQRWMVKWALYETLSEKGVTVTSDIREFRERLVENTAKSQITMDLTNFCRTLQATGLHPDWVPVTAVAEAMNALTEERTLLRTGFLSLFKEGFWDVGALEKLLAGFVIASFKVSYIKDIEGSVPEAVWETAPKWINQPVMFLPAERKLLELRALMDRSLDILREIQRDISRGYTEYIILNYEEYKSNLTDVITSINEFFALDYKAITGVELPDELKLKFVEEYYKPYVNALEIWREVFTIRRVRYWTMRWLGWIMYRVATGVVEKKDVEKFADYVGEEAKLTPKEKDFIKEVLQLMLGIAQRDYIPTPSQLATLSEYLIIEKELIKKAFEDRRVPEEWRNIWQDYIGIRPVVNDIRTLLTTYRRALIRIKVPEDVEKKVMDYAKKIGFGPEEWEILKLRAELEEAMLEAREYVPPLGTLATFAEFMVITTKVMEDVFEARRVPEEWQKLWKQYIVVRPIADDVRGLLTAYRRAIQYIEVPEDLVKKVEDYAKLIGFTAKEMEILENRAKLEEMVREAIENRREYIPTPMMLATLSEFMVIPTDFIKRVFDARRVPEEWRKIWQDYIGIRPVADDIKALLTTYRRALVRTKIPEETQKLVEDYAKRVGFGKEEWDILRLRADLEEMLLESREFVPSLSSLAIFGEYMTIPFEDMEKVFDARKIPEEWRPMWRTYIRARPIADDVKSLLTAYRRSLIYVKLPEELEKRVREYAGLIHFTALEMKILETRAEIEEMVREAIENRREYIPTPMMLSALAEHIKITDERIDDVLKARKVPEEWKGIWKDYIKVRHLAGDIMGVLSAYRRALLYVKIPENVEKEIKDYAKRINFGDEEFKLLNLRAQIEEMILQSREYIPTPAGLATLSEYIKITDERIREVFDARRVPEEWRAVWKDYIDVRPVANDIRGLLTAYRRALIYDKIPEEIKKKVDDYAKLINFTTKEFDILETRARLEEFVLEARESKREYIPTPMMLATLSEFMVIPTDFITRVFDARRVPEEWRPFWKDYIDVRPLVDDVRGLLTAYRRALLYVKIPQDIEKKVKEYADKIRFTDEEWNTLALRTSLEELVLEARESRREYIPTPVGLATIVEYLPKARKFFDEVMEAKRVPEEWIPLWAEYIDIRPLVGEVRRQLSRAERLFTRFAITEETYKKVLEAVKPLGYTNKEIELMLSSANYERFWQAWNELVGDPSRLITLSEYSPRARSLALGQLEKMIDALPIEPERKEFIKQMWQEFIRVRPVYGEVRRYITELISDVAYGIITIEEFKTELEDLKKWGVDDYEIQFYVALAEKRRLRYLVRMAGGSPGSSPLVSGSRMAIAVDRTTRQISETFSKSPYFIIVENGRILDRLLNPHVHETEPGQKVARFIAKYRPEHVVAGSFVATAKEELERLNIRTVEKTGSVEEIISQLRRA